MMDESKTPRYKVRWRHDPKWVGGVLDSSIIQGPVSVAPCQTLVSRLATFSSPQVMLAGSRLEHRCVCELRFGGNINASA
jgi:hypothetical protein